MDFIRKAILMLAGILVISAVVSCDGEGGTVEQTAPDWVIGKWYDAEDNLLVEFTKTSFIRVDNVEIEFDKIGKNNTVKNSVVKRSDSEFSIEQHTDENGTKFDLIAYYLKKESDGAFKYAQSKLVSDVSQISESELKAAKKEKSNSGTGDSGGIEESGQTAPDWTDGEWYVKSNEDLNGDGNPDDIRIATIRKTYFLQRGDSAAEIPYDELGVNNTVKNSIVKNSSTEFSVEQHDEYVDLIVLYIRKKTDGTFEYASAGDFANKVSDVSKIPAESFVSITKKAGTESSSADDVRDNISQVAPDWAIGKWYVKDDIDDFNSQMDEYIANPESEQPDFPEPEIVICKHSFSGVEYNRIGVNSTVRNYVEESNGSVFRVAQDHEYYGVQSHIVTFELTKNNDGSFTKKGGAPMEEIDEDNTFTVVRVEYDIDTGKYEII